MYIIIKSYAGPIICLFIFIHLLPIYSIFMYFCVSKVCLINESNFLQTLNERGGNDRHSGCMMWPGSDFEYQGTLPTFSQRYNETTTWEEKVDRIISWFLDSDNPINLGMMYFDEPDLIVHSFGPDSPELNQQLERVNSIVKYLMDKIVETELWGKLNVIFLSDHGGQPVPLTHVIDLNNYLNQSLYSKYGVSPNLQIYPKPGRPEQ